MLASVNLHKEKGLLIMALTQRKTTTGRGRTGASTSTRRTSTARGAARPALRLARPGGATKKATASAAATRRGKVTSIGATTRQRKKRSA